MNGAFRAKHIGYPLLLGALLAGHGESRVGDGEIDVKAVRHNPDNLDQILWATAENPALRFLSLRVAVRADDIKGAGLRIYRIGDRDYEGFKDFDMQPYARVDSVEYWTSTILFRDEPINDPLHTRWRGYRLWLDDGDDLLWVGKDSLSIHQDKVPRIENLLRLIVDGAAVTGSVDPADATISDRILIVPAWVQDAVFYQILPDRFRDGDASNDPPGTLAWNAAVPDSGGFYGGDLQGLIDGLGYLDSLGVDVLYLNPVFTSPSYHRYDTMNYKQIDPRLGDMDLFRKLLEKAHERNMKIVLEGVFGYASHQHPYFQDAVEFGHESAFWAWFKFHGFPVVTTPAPNYDAWNGRADRPRWNMENPEVREYFLEVIRFWMATGVDGWRFDVPEELPHSFWVQVRETIKAMNPTAYVVGEIKGSGLDWLQGDQFDAIVNTRFRDACLGFFAKDSLDAAGFDEALGAVRADTPEPLVRLSYDLLGNRDTPRWLTACGGDEKRCRLAALFQVTYLGVPALYYGDEIGLTGGTDPGCRAPFPWSPEAQNAPLREFYRYAIRMRKEHPALRRGSFQTILTEGGKYIFLRQSAEEIIMVVINRTAEAASVKLKVPRGVTGVSQKDAVDLLTGAKHPIRSGEIYIKDIAPMTGAVLQLR